MSDKRPIPGQEYILKTHTSAEILKSRGITVHMHWVPGHVQVQGNEKADALAKQGTEGKRLPRDATTSITYLKHKNREQQMPEWKHRWPEMGRGRSYHGRPATNIQKTTTKSPIEKARRYDYPDANWTRIQQTLPGTDTVLLFIFFLFFYLIHTAGKPKAYGIA